MASLKDTIVQGSLRATDTLYSTTAQFQILRAPTTSGGTTFGPGTANNLLKSNGTSVYWSALAASDIPNLSTDKLTSGTLGVARGGTGATTIANIQAGKDGSGNTITSTYLKLSGGTLTGNLTLFAASGNSPALIFSRGSGSNSGLTDWRIFVTEGKLSFQSATDASTWTERAFFADNSGNFTANGTITATAFSGPLTGNVTGNCSGSAGSVAWGNIINKPLTLTAATTGFTIAGGTTSKTLTVADNITLKSGSATYLTYYSSAGIIGGHRLAHFNDTYGEGSANGKNELVLGNAIAKSTNGSAYGELTLYSPGTKGVALLAAETSTDWYIATLPAKTGTIAYLDDITATKVGLDNVTNNKQATAVHGIYFGTCETAQATAAKIVKLSDATNFSATTGAVIAVKFTNASCASMTLTIQNSGGTQLLAAKEIHYVAGSAMNASTDVYGWRANSMVIFIYDGTRWIRNYFWNSTYWTTTVYTATAAATAAKAGSCSAYDLSNNGYLMVLVTQTNTAQAALTLNINSKGAKPIYINGTISSSSNYSLPAGLYLVHYDGTNYYFRTDHYITGDITGTASNVRSTVAIENGGTGATSAEGARSNLGLGSWATKSSGTGSDVGLGNVENTKLSTWTGSSNIKTVGTVTTGTWSATAIGATKGGTGQTTYTKGDILYCSGANTLSKLNATNDSTKRFLSCTSQVPSWTTLSKSDVGLGNVENTKLSTWTGSSYITTIGTLSSLWIKGSTNTASINFEMSEVTGDYPVKAGRWGILHVFPGTSAHGSFIRFAQMSQNSNNEPISNSEYYELPTTTKNLSDSVIYDILTTKNAVTVEQGGTGATTAAGALTNLGIANKIIDSSSSGSNNGYCKFTDGTLIQWGHTTVNKTLTQVASSGIYFSTAEISFSASFLNTNYTVSGTSRYSTGHMYPIGAIPNNTTKATIGVYDFYARSGNIDIYWQAIGCWK